jgi:hypothetical protein
VLYEADIAYNLDCRKRNRVEVVIGAYASNDKKSSVFRVELDEVTGVVLSMSEEPGAVWAGQ